MKGLNKEDWIIYGAYGYTGKLVLEEALAKGRRPIVAGRNEAKLKPLAEQYGLAYRVFNIEDAAKNLEDAGTLINCAGPFEITSEPMMDACIECGLNYFDITGEITVFQAAHQRNEAAKKAGIIISPGVGFDIVPTDCLAALLKQELPDATHLELAFDFGTLPSVGTAVTAIRAIGAGGMIRENGKLKQVGHGYHHKKIPFPGVAQWGTSVAWGDVFTSKVSTNIPNAIVYTALPRVVCWSFKFTNLIKGLLASSSMQQRLVALAEKYLDEGPDELARNKHKTRFWGQATANDGRKVGCTITAPSVYALTAETTVAIAIESESINDKRGYFTASMLVGADFLNEREGYQVQILRSE